MGVNVRERPKGSGVFWVFINHQGKRKAKRIGSEDAAKEVAKKIEAKLTLQEFKIEEKTQDVPLFKDYAETWSEGYIKPLRRQSTHERYTDVLKRYVNPEIGHLKIDQIKRRDLRNLLLKIHILKSRACHSLDSKYYPLHVLEHFQHIRILDPLPLQPLEPSHLSPHRQLSWHPVKMHQWKDDRFHILDRKPPFQIWSRENSPDEEG